MKTRIVFAFLFVMAGMASAALQISVNGDLNPADLEYSLSPGSQTLILGVWTADLISGDGGYFALLVLNSQGTISGGYTEIIASPLEPWPAGPEEMNGVYGTTIILDPIAAGTIVFDGISFHCVSTEDAVVQLYAINDLDWTLGPLMDQVVIDQTEPDAISTPTLVKTTSLPAIATRVNSGRTETFVASGAVSSQGHALEYNFTWGDGTTSGWGAATRIKTYTYSAATTYNVTVQARCIAHPTVLSAVSPVVPLTTECYSSSVNVTAYAAWAQYNRQSCWCCRYNCRGDADCRKVGLYPINSLDLNGLKTSYTKQDSACQTIFFDPDGTGTLPPVPCICYDFDRRKVGLYRVNSSDLSALKQYYTKPDSAIPPCPLTTAGGDIIYYTTTP